MIISVCPGCNSRIQFSELEDHIETHTTADGAECPFSKRVVYDVINELIDQDRAKRLAAKNPCASQGAQTEPRTV
ncbi:MAG: hypothetical protein HY918_01935 [Candidatus Doudnabacteria bacterium]|nr:hypothetical protein [Candidatus Doudnabacteria bacterium]